VVGIRFRPQPRLHPNHRLWMETSRRFSLKAIYEKAMKLPDSAQTLIPEAQCQPDFLYEASKVAVFCDGSVHDTAEQQKRDQIKRDNLEFNSPYSVFSIRYDQDLSQQLADLASLI